MSPVVEDLPAAVGKAFDPDQPRDEHGRWTSGGSHYVGPEDAPGALGRWKAESRFSDLVDLLQASAGNQRTLASIGSAIAASLGVAFADPGPKTPESARRKFETKGYETAGEMTDLVRAGFTAPAPADADAVVAALAEQLDVIDEGWARTPLGYVDRKVLVRFPDSQIGEVQIWEPNLIDAKNTRGHALYEEWRRLPFDDPRREGYAAEMRRLYSAALEKAGPSWEAVSRGDGGRFGKRASNTSRSSTLADIPTSALSTGRHSPRRNAQAARGVQTAGRPSQEQ
ncbi:hypothetical protein LRS73_05210 [Methylobacterium currus]|uniref:hypothetical protein n=1 Tax=Methylobacterium currus TaxID=2051553 RepID=UPI001E587570|nr:hypothetical protein [Methylobacterium currus]UHC17295.1 hypothetical protein LRS73_05210 [Methylobacterium currus]